MPVERPVTMVRLGGVAVALCRRGSEAEQVLRRGSRSMGEPPSKLGWSGVRPDEILLLLTILVVLVLLWGGWLGGWPVVLLVLPLAVRAERLDRHFLERHERLFGERLDLGEEARARSAARDAERRASEVLARVDLCEVLSAWTSPEQVWHLYLQAYDQMRRLQPAWDGHPDTVVADHFDLYQAMLDQILVVQDLWHRGNELARACRETQGICGDADVDELPRLLSQARDRYDASVAWVEMLVAEADRRIVERRAVREDERQFEARVRAAGLRRRIEMEDAK